MLLFRKLVNQYFGPKVATAVGRMVYFFYLVRTVAVVQEGFLVFDRHCHIAFAFGIFQGEVAHTVVQVVVGAVETYHAVGVRVDVALGYILVETFGQFLVRLLGQHHRLVNAVKRYEQA